MLNYGQWVQVKIKSAPAEWIGLIDLEPTIHRINIQVSNVYPTPPAAARIIIAECPLALEEQLRNSKAMHLAYRHFKSGWSYFRLTAENKIQKIYTPYRYNLEKDFIVQTTYPELFQQYLNDYMEERTQPEEIEGEIEEEDNDHYWQTMGP